MASLSIVLVAIPSTIARAARSGAGLAPPGRAMASVSASTLASPSSAPLASTPVSPQKLCTAFTASIASWMITASLMAENSRSGLGGRSCSSPSWSRNVRRKTNATIAAAMSRAGRSRSASGAVIAMFTIAAMMIARGMVIMHAATTPAPSGPDCAGARRLSRVNASVTAVDDTRPPSAPESA